MSSEPQATRSIKVKMARATKEDFDRVIEFMSMIEEFMDYGTWSGDDGEDAEELSDDEFVELLGKKWGVRPGPALVDSAWRRVIFGGQMAIENACDPSLDYLDFKPEIKAAMEAAAK